MDDYTEHKNKNLENKYADYSSVKLSYINDSFLKSCLPCFWSST